jgi:hypothetical protein
MMTEAKRSDWLRYAPQARELEEGKKWTVFLSYRSVNRPWVLNLYDVLRERGHTVFLDQVVLLPGDELEVTLAEHLDDSQAGVLVWSRAAADSAWVKREYQRMSSLADRERDFVFVPIRLDNTPLPGFADEQIFVDFTAYPDGPNGGELLRLLHAVVGARMSEEAVRFAEAQDQSARRLNARIEAAIENGDRELLVELYQSGGLAWEVNSVLASRAIEGLTQLKHYHAAIEMAAEVEKAFPSAIRPRQLHALALARLADDTRDSDPAAAQAALREAQDTLGTLMKAGHRDPETLGIYARTWMDRYATTGDVLALRKSRDLYKQAFEGAQDDYYTGINAASKSVLLGTEQDMALGRELAAQVEAIVGTETEPDDYWLSATVGEVHLLQGHYEKAARAYMDAVSSAPSERGSHESTWQQADRLMEKLSPSAEERAAVRKAFEHLDDRP